MSFWSKNKKKKEGKEVTSQSLATSNGVIVHSSSTSLFSRTQFTTETRTTTVHTSQSSLNSLTEKCSNASGSNSSLQKSDKKDLFFSFNDGNLSPTVVREPSIDATPFTRGGIYKSSPSRPTAQPAPVMPSYVNLNYQSPYANNRFRTVSAGSPTTYPAINQPRQITLPLPNPTEELKGKLVVKVRESEKFFDDPQSKVPTYSTRSKKRGKVLVINNIKFANGQHVRTGAELDETNIVQLFTQMDFEVVKSRDLNKKDMETKIKNFRDGSSLKKVDIGGVVIMSHGTGKESSGSTEVVCTDNALLSTTWIINQFDGECCPNLRGKPKIFIFQCCRGDNRDVTVQHDNTVSKTMSRKLSDMLIAYSTVPGFVSHRDPQNGTWYIQAICKVFMEHAYDTDVENLLKIVDSTLARIVSDTGTKQTSSFENRGFKTCFLHPKLYQ